MCARSVWRVAAPGRKDMTADGKMSASVAARGSSREHGQVSTHDGVASLAQTTTSVPAMVSDVTRNLTSLAVAVAFTLVTFFAYNAFRPLTLSIATVALTSFVFWLFYSLSYLVLTQFTFARATADELVRWMAATTPRRRAQRIAASLSGGGPPANAHWSVLAIIAVAAVWLTPGLLDSVTANVLAFLVVGSSWIVTVYAYAVHYARLDAASPSLAFPGDAKPVFADYFYLSAQVATTFSSSDVTILTTVGRRVVTGQTLIAFVFSTFVIAMLLAVIFLSN